VCNENYSVECFVQRKSREYHFLESPHFEMYVQEQSNNSSLVPWRGREEHPHGYSKNYSSAVLEDKSHQHSLLLDRK